MTLYVVLSPFPSWPYTTSIEIAGLQSAHMFFLVPPVSAMNACSLLSSACSSQKQGWQTCVPLQACHLYLHAQPPASMIKHCYWHPNGQRARHPECRLPCRRLLLPLTADVRVFSWENFKNHRLFGFGNKTVHHPVAIRAVHAVLQTGHEQFVNQT